MNIQDFQKITERYRNEIIKNNSDMINEKSLLSALRSSIEWLNYNDEERHESHKVILSVATKTNNYEQFEFQILLIEIYDLLLSLKDIFVNQHEDETVFRLISIVDICKFYKNEYRDLSQVNIYPFKVLLEYIKIYEEYDVLINARSILQELKEKVALAILLNGEN